MTRRQAVSADDADGIQRQGERTWYLYDAAGQRVRKVSELAAQQLKDERLYLDGLEIYRRTLGNSLVRQSLHIRDGRRLIAVVEMRTVGDESDAPALRTRYQVVDHLGSVHVELDDKAQIISYEEYSPFGSTLYHAEASSISATKRYRYAAKERDEESGFYFYGARYYSPWLGRWISCDPAGLVDGLNRYWFVKNNSVRLSDVDGRAGEDPNDPPKGAHGKNPRTSTKQWHEDANARRRREQSKRQDREREVDRTNRRRNPKGEDETEKTQRENRERKERYRKEAERERAEKERDPEQEREEREQREREARRREKERKNRKPDDRQEPSKIPQPR